MCVGGGGICPIRCRSENSNVFLNLFPKLEFDIVSNLQKNSWQSPNTNYSEIVDFQITWIREIPLLLILLDDKNSSVSKVYVRSQPFAIIFSSVVIKTSRILQHLDVCNSDLPVLRL